MADKFQRIQRVIDVLSKKHLKLEDTENITEEEAQY